MPRIESRYTLSIVVAACCCVILSRGHDLVPIPSISLSCPHTTKGHFQCGEMIGTEFTDEISASIQNSAVLRTVYAKILEERKTPKPTNSLLLRTFQSMKIESKRVYPYYVEEIRGIASGSNQSFDHLLAYNFLQELVTADPSSVKADVSDHCTEVLLPNQFAHNEDGSHIDMKTIFLVHMRFFRDDTGETVEDFTALTYPGRLSGWGPGFNRHGIVWTSNMLYPSLEASTSYLEGGISTVFVSRDMTRASSFDEAIEICTPPNLIAGQNQNFGDVNTGEVVTVETAPGGHFDRMDIKNADHVVFHANEYLRLTDVNQFPEKIVSAQHRHAAFLREQAAGELLPTANGLLHFLGDTTDAQYPVFRDNDTTKEFTILTVHVDLAAGTFSIYRANPRDGGRSLLSVSRIR